MAREHEEAAVWWDLNPGEPTTGPYPRPKPSCSYNLSGRTAVWLGLEQQTSRSQNFKTEALNVILLIHVVLIVLVVLIAIQVARTTEDLIPKKHHKLPCTKDCLRQSNSVCCW